MKTYSETRGIFPFDWNQVLDDLIAGKESEYDLDKISNRASYWVTCAVGNLCDIIPRNNLGEPIDRKLSFLGNYFPYLIKNKYWHGAKEILQQIELCSAELINEIQK